MFFERKVWLKNMVTKKKEIYYVEDDENIAQTVSDFLGKHGYQVLIFATIADARNALQNRCPTLVLVDWNMPDGNGAVLCQWIRAKWKELPIIFLTVRGDSRDIVSGFGNGADDYVVKPFVLEVLLSRIGALLRRTGGCLRTIFILRCHLARPGKNTGLLRHGRNSFEPAGIPGTLVSAAE